MHTAEMQNKVLLVRYAVEMFDRLLEWLLIHQINAHLSPWFAIAWVGLVFDLRSM